MPSAPQSRISEATETLARSRSSLETKPLVRPARSATSAMLMRAASLADFSCAPMRVPSGTASGTPFPSLAADTGPTSDETLGSFMKQRLTIRKPAVIIAPKAGHIQQEAAMATQSREPTFAEEQERGLLGQIEVHSIDWIPDTERHGKTWQQAMLWFLGNFQYFTIPIGFVGPALGLSLGWSILAGVAGIAFGTLFMAFHATQGPVFGLPQIIQSRAQLGYRGVIVAIVAALFTYMAFNVADQILMSSGLNGASGWSSGWVAAATAVIAALLAIFGHDWVHRVFRFLLVISLPCYLIISIAILVGHAPHHPGGFIFAAFMAQFATAAAYNITYAPYVSDYTRYMPRDTSPRGIIAAVFFGASGSAIWLIALGAWLPTPPRRPRRPVRAGAGGRQRGRAARHGHRVPVRHRAARHHGHERLRGHAHGADRHRLVPPDQGQPHLEDRDDRGARDHLVRGRRGDLEQRQRHRREYGAGLAHPDAVPAGAVDGAQPGGLLLRPPRPLRDHRHLPARRRLREVGLARPDRLRRRVRRDDPVHGAAAAVRPLLRGLRSRASRPRRRLLVAGRARRLRSGVSGSVPVARPGPGARRDRGQRSRTAVDHREFNECLKASRRASPTASPSAGRCPGPSRASPSTGSSARSTPRSCRGTAASRPSPGCRG